MVILDTCAIIEALQPSPTFSAKTAQLINAGAYILSISFAEIACKIKSGKLELSLSTRKLVQKYNQLQAIEIVDIGVNEWLDSIELTWDENKDPADRLITAFAAKKKCPIVTTDQKIARFYSKVIW
jgi:PIN domain nuclease of toxin-antitoxin system